MGKIIAAALLMGALSAAPAHADPIQVGPCSDPDSIKVQVGQTATVCAYVIDTNECDSNDINVRVGTRTFCVRVP